MVKRVRGVYIILISAVFLSTACQWHLPTDGEDTRVSVERYDRAQSLYLTSADYSALQQMNIRYPMQTRMLIEDVLRIGHVSDPDINSKLLYFYRDSILQSLISDVEYQYANVDDISNAFTSAFKRLREHLQDIPLPNVYTQIGALNQSVVISDSLIGISLDKYLGADYPLYAQYYPKSQRDMMTREMIVPDCLVFYILSFYPLPEADATSHEEADLHMGKIQWLVNKVMGKKVFDNKDMRRVEQFMRTHKDVSVEQLLADYTYINLF